MAVPRFAFGWQRREGGGEFDELIRSVRAFLSRLPGARGGGGNGEGFSLRWGRLAPPIALLVLVLWLGSGVYIVNPGEVAVVRTFGAWNGAQIGSGLHWRVPWPVQRVDILSIERIHSLELGFRSIGQSGSGQGFQVVPEEARMITGDENLVDAQLVVQYRVRDAGMFLFNVKDPSGRPDGETLQDITASALRQIVGQRPIDDVLTTGKQVVQVETQQLLQRLLDGYGTGIHVVNVQLQDVQPPNDVQAAFKDVISAREDRARFINEAEAYREDVLPRARGEAARITQDAEAYKAEQTARAAGEASRFTARLVEYRTAEDATRRRLFIEMMERVLPSVRVIVVDPEVAGNILPFLDLDAISTTNAGGDAR